MWRRRTCSPLFPLCHTGDSEHCVLQRFLQPASNQEKLGLEWDWVAHGLTLLRTQNQLLESTFFIFVFCFLLFWLGFSFVISVYAPTLQVEARLKEAFYRDQHYNLLQQVDSKDKLLFLGDFNARVEWDSELWKEVLSKRGIGSCSDDGHLLLEFCSESEHQLIITNTLFQQKDRFKATWRNSHSKH